MKSDENGPALCRELCLNTIHTPFVDPMATKDRSSAAAAGPVRIENARSSETAC